MKQLTTEQQEQAIELIEKLVHSTEQSAIYNRAAFIESAKAFLNSLKPKVYLCYIDESDILYLQNISEDYWTVSAEAAFQFNSIEEARKILNTISKFENCRYFILTE